MPLLTKRFEIAREQTTAFIHITTKRPILFRHYQHFLTKRLESTIWGNPLDFRQILITIEPVRILAIIECNHAIKHGILFVFIVIKRTASSHISCFASKNFRRIFQFRTSRPFSRRQWIAATTHRAFAVFVTDPQGISIDPTHAMFRIWNIKRIFRHKLLLHRVKLSHLACVCSPIAQRNQTPIRSVIFPRAVTQKICTFIHPRFSFLFRQRVNVQHRFPFRFRLLVLLPRRSSPDPFHVLCVLPKIVQKIASDAHVRHSIFIVEYLEQLVV
mmetsp:Transcript_1228/g.3627  ORF Transcript_1228/g.3627 Transcript_1228/m.3627 type:complete len:272 (-) Transcript_1228:59-874(-)